MTEKPVIHARDHRPGGADPLITIPAAVTFPDKIAELAAAHPNHLFGYWRLGEGSSPFADTSGWVDGAGTPRPAPATHATPTGSPPLMNDDITGALPTGQDDGAVAFTGGSSSTAQQHLHAVEGVLPSRFNILYELTVCAWVAPAADPAAFTGQAVGNYEPTVSFPYPNTGWRLAVTWPDLTPVFQRADVTSGHSVTLNGSPLTSGQWVFLVGTYSASEGTKLYVNGSLVGSDATIFQATGNPNEGVIMGGRPGGGGPSGTADSYKGGLDEVSVWDIALTNEEIGGLFAGASATDMSDKVVGIDDSGNLGLVDPKVEVIVNGDPQTASTTPAPAPVPPSDPSTSPPVTGLDWIMDQPFTWDGPDFEVPANKWTTIPFTSPLMERQSNITTGGVTATTFVEINWDDPAAAGWIDPSTPRMFTVPHDMEFWAQTTPYGAPDPYSLWQICLKLESPTVAPTSSWRYLRIFETTHQKPVIFGYCRRDDADAMRGYTNVHRDNNVPGWTGDRPTETFAKCDAGGLDPTPHPGIMFMPDPSMSWFIPGQDWLPKVDGVPTLKKGMKLVPQVWHDAPQTLTFHCSNPYPYRPHFVVNQQVQRSWGSPWSDWPTP